MIKQWPAEMIEEVRVCLEDISKALVGHAQGVLSWNALRLRDNNYDPERHLIYSYISGSAVSPEKEVARIIITSVEKPHGRVYFELQLYTKLELDPKLIGKAGLTMARSKHDEMYLRTNDN